MLVVHYPVVVVVATTTAMVEQYCSIRKHLLQVFFTSSLTRLVLEYCVPDTCTVASCPNSFQIGASSLMMLLE
jgi:hypothetical protein